MIGTNPSTVVKVSLLAYVFNILFLSKNVKRAFSSSINYMWNEVRIY